MNRHHVGYQWKLREIMATRGLFTTTHLAPLLAERGIELSASQIHRLVTGTPERLSLPVLAALCDLLEVTPAELILTHTDPQTRPTTQRPQHRPHREPRRGPPRRPRPARPARHPRSRARTGGSAPVAHATTPPTAAGLKGTSAATASWPP